MFTPADSPSCTFTLQVQVPLLSPYGFWILESAQYFLCYKLSEKWGKILLHPCNPFDLSEAVPHYVLHQMLNTVNNKALTGFNYAELGMNWGQNV